MPKQYKDFYTSREAAELLGVAVSTIQLWTKNGLLEAWTTGGGHRRIARGAVEAILKQQQSISNRKQPEQQLSVVMVEDNEKQLRLYEKQFHARYRDVSVVTAKDGYGGLIKIGATLPDVIITDLVMPNMDGFQMIKALKDVSELSHSLIIVITGLKNEEIEAKGGLPKDVHVFTKPISFDEMENLIRENIFIRAA